MKENYTQVLVNYSAKDNQANNNKPGWIESFSYVLGMMISQISKEKTELNLIQEVKVAELDEALKSSKAIINVYSDNFDADKKANTCLEKINSSKEYAEKAFYVYKTHHETNDSSLKSYDFYIDSDEGSISWDPEFDSEFSRDYWLKIVDLAYDIVNIYVKEKAFSSKTVFIAESIPEQNGIRDAIKRDLRQHGYKILPDKRLSKEKASLEKELLKYAKEADLSIHIMGEKYGSKSQLKDISISDFQNKVISKYCEKNPDNLKRIIWISPDHRNTDLEQAEYLEHLRKNKEELSSAELIQTPIELLKSIALAYLHDHSSNGQSKNQKHKKVEMIEEGGVYLIHDISDKTSVKSIVEWFGKNNIKVLTPDFELRHDQLMIDHKQKLIKSDGVMIYCNHGNQQWSKTKIKDLIKAPGLGRNKPFQFKCLYLASEPNLKLKDQVENSDFIIIENTDRFSSSMMSPLLSKAK
jgi:hypothetical protein